MRHAPAASVGPKVLDAAAIAHRVRELAAGLDRDYPGGDLTLVALLPAGAALTAALSRDLTVPHALDAIAISPFAADADDAARLVREPARPIAGRRVVLVDAVVDTGLALRFALGQLAQAGPASLEACVLVDRWARRLIDDLPLRPGGLPLRDGLLAGFGLGTDGTLRGLPDIHAVD